MELARSFYSVIDLRIRIHQWNWEIFMINISIHNSSFKWFHRKQFFVQNGNRLGWEFFNPPPHHIYKNKKNKDKKKHTHTHSCESTGRIRFQSLFFFIYIVINNQAKILLWFELHLLITTTPWGKRKLNRKTYLHVDIHILLLRQAHFSASKDKNW